jgi:hypothetical protein
MNMGPSWPCRGTQLSRCKHVIRRTYSNYRGRKVIKVPLPNDENRCEIPLPKANNSHGRDGPSRLELGRTSDWCETRGSFVPQHNATPGQFTRLWVQLAARQPRCSGIALLFHGDVICQEAMRSPMVFNAAGAIAVENSSHRVSMDPKGCRVV